MKSVDISIISCFYSCRFIFRWVVTRISFLVKDFVNFVSFILTDVQSFFKVAIKNCVNLILIVILRGTIFCYNFSLISDIGIISNCTRKRNITGLFTFQSNFICDLSLAIYVLFSSYFLLYEYFKYYIILIYLLFLLCFVILSIIVLV
ncbi:Na+/H+ antiporter nhaC [Borrelia sp. HM]|nr:Na+/H+ antiporter nhaC [Borrelia sp. HM]